MQLDLGHLVSEGKAVHELTLAEPYDTGAASAVFAALAALAAAFSPCL
jgi:hypothetical protein